METKQAYVGMDLDTTGGEVVQAIIDAIKQDNKDAVVEDYMVYKKVKAPKQLVLRRETVEDLLGSDWEMDRIHIYMSSYFGFIKEWDEDQLIIHWENEE
ncbi:MmoB/DmpM family protein [Aneurinibacillus tyrosinisolvens]|uniref:MmoB/DmpM family protein n=1 Tax=Aneurinibacillus tyrosinisolvens TaxID=1443435 RepID=UPI00063FA3A0|nr:MmoB/DmpM family protein [Aneurinibacillus tyrosinisolvens]